jgi:NAD(P)-dependent dehydrogenase (short-subunit alcohol dehydrogenase family)/acyl carrier protein
LVRTADGNPVAGGLQPTTLAPRLSLGTGGGQLGPAQQDGVVTEFLRNARELIAAQREVMLGYLGASAAPAVGRSGAAPAPALAQAPPEPGLTALPPAQPAPAGPAGRAQIAEAVAAVISARTGYPRDMLGTDLDLEADLSIDSIKRTEIIAALAEELGLAMADAADGESIIAELAQIKTISGITDWLDGHIGGGASSRGAADVGVTGDGQRPGGPTEPVGPTGPASGLPHAGQPRRFLVQDVDLAPAGGELADGGRFLILDDGRGIALELAELLEQRGARTVTTEAPTEEQLGAADALVHLGTLRPGGEAVLPGEFPVIRTALAGRTRTLLVVTGTGGAFGRGRDDDPRDLGLRGMIRTIAAEYPDVLARAVDVEPKESPQVIAAQLLAELADRSGPTVTGYRGGQRVGLRVRETRPLPAVDGIGLDRDSVVLITGGARGITASVALALARSAGCHIELAGRTPPPGSPDLEAEAVGDPAGIRRILVRRGLESPREIEAETGRLLRAREMRVNLGRLREAAASVRYHAVDVRDAVAVGSLINDVYGRHGRLDGVIHGAGILEDRLVRDKTPESFARVYSTKVDGARALMAGLRDDVRFFVLFGSVSGVFGNRGQADYSAANDALDSMAHAWAARMRGRVVAVDWGPWAGGGMISPELEREYARRGITLIDPGEGASCLLTELAVATGPAQVIYMCDGVPGD